MISPAHPSVYSPAPVTVYTRSEVEEVPCPLCGAERFERLYVERGALGIVRCRECELVYVNPRLKDPGQVHNFFKDAERCHREARLIFEGLATHHQDPNYLADLRLLARFRPSGKLLDIGSGMGFFLQHAQGAQGRRWSVTGVEPSPGLAELARTRFGLEVVTGFLADARFPDGSFDVVTMTDMLEHVGHPRRLLKEVRRVLSPGGLVMVKVPNGLYNVAKLKALSLLGKAQDFDLFDSHQHVVHYSDATLRRMLRECGFRPIHVDICRPVQLPAWQRYVGDYYLYPIPWVLDWRRQLARSVLYRISYLGYLLRGRRVGWLAPNIVLLAEKLSDPATSN